ncbi:thioredoxin [Roseobacter sp. HKCCD9010]|uniref:thioredoxin family protein n=1 Tax=unclassified Roseobacter TaxID=196798 RepID=UPI001492F6A7|nr:MULTISPECIES: thioredoxin family protein [unclassified Roseobacter]MBF9051035.1 thioredoxin [Rhodobacterales bacterium HKCCD4356]NNV12804.1 thioredoxin [Roseobacter sp. HKCCD7357]NNV16749.1 thioredoxin [Roseobacter sp. HKCCD8768]NNV26619.1 thioredoxin [Roseobacter sp. HKCCD8192]NNV30469.1 thioredoxin [Roseobacter sp. HKCCD9061]
MNRRELLIMGAASAVMFPNLGHATTLNYTPGLAQERLAAGETVLLDFAAHWCTTCRAQERVIGQLRGDNPAYEDAITFIRVDWDQYSGAEITQRLAVPRRSTLILLRGDEELGRIVAGTRTADIQALLDLALT